LKVYFASILFLAFAIRPIYNIGYVAYFELNIDYIIENYCVNKKTPQLTCKGKCHLAKQLTLESSKSNKTTPVNILSQAFFPVFFKAYQIEDFPVFVETVLDKNWYYLNKKNALFKDNFTPPPQYLIS